MPNATPYGKGSKHEPNLKDPILRINPAFILYKFPSKFDAGDKPDDLDNQAHETAGILLDLSFFTRCPHREYSTRAPLHFELPLRAYTDTKTRMVIASHYTRPEGILRRVIGRDCYAGAEDELIALLGNEGAAERTFQSLVVEQDEWPLHCEHVIYAGPLLPAMEGGTR